MRARQSWRGRCMSWSARCVVAVAIAVPGMNAAGAEHFLALADLGTPTDARPDGNADRLLWDDARGCLIVHYLNANGLDREDRSDQVVTLEIVEPGEGYGRTPVGLAGLRVRSVPAESIAEAERAKLLEQDPDHDPAQPFELWTRPLEVEDTGTEGGGLKATAILDGRAGAWSYYPLDHPWEQPLLTGNDFVISSDDNDLQITYGGSGYHLPASLIGATQSRLRVHLRGADLGTLGFTPGGRTTKSLFIPGSDEPVTDTVTFVDITGDVINPFASRPGNWRNFLAHTPATGDASSGWRVPWAATKVGQIADVLVVPDGMGHEKDVTAVEEIETVPSPELTAVVDEPEREAVAMSTRDDKASTTAATEEDVDVDDDEAPVAVEALEMDSSELVAAILDTEPTSGIGYEPGVFEIRDSKGTVVNGWVIRYETDMDGRIYVNAKGAAKRVMGNLDEDRIGVPGADVYEHGWVIERNPAAIVDARGWTLHPQGMGTGFQCDGIRIFGELLALPPMSNHTDGPDGFDVGSAPEIVITPVPGLQSASLAKHDPEFECRTPATGRVIGAVIDQPGNNYYRVPLVTPGAGATGTGAVLVASLGDDGRRTITSDGETALVDLAGWEAHPNGDFNGDGIIDLFLHHPETGQSCIWNLDDGATVQLRNGQPVAHALPTLSSAWQIGGIGRFGLNQPGCCILWRNAYTGQNALWIIDTSSPRPGDWIQSGSNFLPSVIDLGWEMACTNNAARNVGDRLYWVDSGAGSVAQWKIDVDPNTSVLDWVDEPDYLRDAEGERIVGMRSSWELVGAGSLGGQPRSDGSNAFRDLVFFDRDTGRVAVWLLDGSGTRIDEEAPNGGAGFMTRAGSVIAGDIRFCRPVGIGQYALDGIQWSQARDDGMRTQWFPTLGWSLYGDSHWFTWRLDREVDRIRTSRRGLREGTGRSAKPFEVDQLR